MNVLVTGSSGLVGSALRPVLTAAGHQVRRLLRAPSTEPGTTFWDPSGGRFVDGALDGIDAVVHLAGENIAGGRWTADRKNQIRNSRVRDTRNLCEGLAALETPPKVLVAASAIGFYGDRGDEPLDESAQPGHGFLPQVCEAWEAATLPARSRGIRVVYLRLGIVLSRSGGALATMVMPFKLGVGGVLGTGDQYMSWVSLTDVVNIVAHALTNDSLQGPLNAVAPGAVTNREFTKALGKVLRRPTVFPMPAFAARLVFGEMAEALLLSGARIMPAVLQGSGFRFDYPDLVVALRHELGLD